MAEADLRKKKTIALEKQALEEQKKEVEKQIQNAKISKQL